MSRYRTPSVVSPVVDDGSWDVNKTVQRVYASTRVSDLPPVGSWSQYRDLACLSFETVSGRESENLTTQHYTVDHLALGSMKNGANSVMPCELQDT